MVGGGQIQKVDIGPNPEARGWIAPQQAYGGAYGPGTLKRPFSQGFGEPSKLGTNSNSAASLDINYSNHYPSMEQRDQHEGGEDGAAVEQRGVYGPQLGREQEWGQEDRAGVESDYQEVAGVRGDMSVSEGSASEGTEEEEDEEEDEDDDDDGDMVENDVDDGNDDKEGQDGVTEQVERASGVPGLQLAHSAMGGLDQSGQGRQELLRVDAGFQRNISDRGRATLKATIGTIGATGTSTSPFGMFQSPSATMPFLNSFTSPSTITPPIGGGVHAEVTPTQNGGGMTGIGSASGASYSLTRDGELSRDATRERFRETALVTPLLESARTPSGPLHEQLHTTDVDNYYTTLLNTQAPPNNGLKRAGSGSGRDGDPQSTAETSLRRILSDPLTGALMDDAMIISCGHSVGNAGRRRVMETSVCIICGASVRTEAMAPNYALRVVVQAFKREEEMNGNLSLRSAKRRRETIQEPIGLPEQVAAEAAKVKGVQFPFVVSDRVMIKGNKRTPERFVGREAVITTQCLNGWYLVRTLDTGESVRLQYRSLQKVGGPWEENEPAMAEFAGVNNGAPRKQ